MFNDWIWAFSITMIVLLEVWGWSLWLRRFFPQCLSVTFAFAALSQLYFFLSLIKFLPAWLHFLLCCVGISMFFFAKNKEALEKTLHLRLARYFSPMSWQKIWPWLVLPSVWIALKITDALVPHRTPEALSIYLHAPKMWFEQGTQTLDPFNPLQAIASVWESFYLHLHAIHQLFNSTHRSTLVRTQISSQLFHLLGAQLVVILLITETFKDFFEKCWRTLTHAAHATTLAVPSAFGFAWLACSNFFIGPTGTIAKNDWAATLFLFGGFACHSNKSLKSNWEFSFFLIASAFAINQNSLPGCLAVMALLVLRNSRPSFSWIKGAIALALGLGPWFYRNYTQAGKLIFPGMYFLGEYSKNPGWFISMNLYESSAIIQKYLIAICLIGALLFVLTKKSKQDLVRDVRLQDFLIFSGLLAIFSLILHRFSHHSQIPLEYTTLTVSVILSGLLIFEIVLTEIARKQIPFIHQFAAYLGFFLCIFAVPLPFHLVWQHLSLAFKPSDYYLKSYHLHYPAKLWASLQLPKEKKIAWSNDSEFFYVEQPSSSIRDSSILRNALALASTPREKVERLCELGYDILAWETELRNRPELAGLGSWIKLNKSNILYHDDEVYYFSLLFVCQSSEKGVQSDSKGNL